MSTSTLHFKKQSNREHRSSLSLRRKFTKEGTHPFDEITWVLRDAVVGSSEKRTFEQNGVEFPDFWSPHAVNITASKYFRGKLGTPLREASLKQMITRVTRTIRAWGEQFGYFESPAEAQIFEDELTHIIAFQKASFNSPVWFNVGTREKPQCSACFILSVEDTMTSILEWIRTEGIIFKGGSGSGVNLSPLRSKKESLSGGGKSSGPVSFMRGADSVAGMIKSGGATRRAAKMVVLNIGHPDVLEFIRCKAEEEKKVRALMDAGYNMSDLNNDAWNSIQFQNANNTVRITDDFMHAVEEDGVWQTRFVMTDEVADTYRARDLLMQIAESAWQCGDPGVQFDTIINEWHTCPNTGRINASNPCSEYMHLDNSACNLASINLMKFIQEDGAFMTGEFKHTVDCMILAQDIIVSGSGYPTERIAENARKFRELGLGYANLGSLLMTKGLPYDSERGRAWAAAISSLLAGEAYRYSTAIARRIGPFEGYETNRDPMLHVIEKHRDASRGISGRFIEDKALLQEAQKVWDEALRYGEQNGYRNSQVTVIAPTGTIAFMMDCDTTGVEPDFSLVKMKQLVGGGWMKIINSGVPNALRKLGYTEDETQAIIDWVSENGAVEGAPHFKDEHLAIFDCAVKPAKGNRSISWQGHVKMVGAVQPFISGAISKTFNMSHETTKEEIFDAYVMAWKLGIKAFAVYRDGSKATQPLQTAHSGKKDSRKSETVSRRHLPATRKSETHKFLVAGHEGFLTYSVYEDGTLAEIFIRMAKQGSTLSGLLDAFAISVSMALQYGVPLKSLARRFVYMRFEPAGFTDNENVRVATSIVDYIFRYLAIRFLSADELTEFGIMHVEETASAGVDKIQVEINANANGNGKHFFGKSKNILSGSGLNGNGFVSGETVCRKCGGMMIRTGTCLTCLQCGEASGGCS